jgi:Na+-translocating ferredoxin:NAD+ oxidoreductase subunit D
MIHTANSPFLRQPTSVRSVMSRVLLALLPGVMATIWLFGPAVLVQLALASLTALIAEAIALRLRAKPVWLFVSDGSALVTAWLIALSIPPIAPAWLVVLGTLFAIVVAKHLYGGLGQNPFNPAMVAFAILIVAYPHAMSQWPATGGDFTAHWQAITGARNLDAITMATPLDSARTALHVSNVLPSELPNPGLLVALAYALGGLYLLAQRLITWHLPTAFIATLALCAGLAHLYDPARFADPLFHLLTGGALLGAFFIITDPVSGCTTPRGKLIFGALAAVLVWVIRSFGAYPDGIAFAVLLMNIAAPLIDLLTQPPVFGHKGSAQGASRE